MRLPRLTGERLAIALFAVIAAALACLMPVHNDTWWHLRYGHDMVRDHALQIMDRYSYTAAGRFFWNHSWIGQLVLYALYAAGGLPLVTAGCAAIVVAAWLLTWRLMRGPLDMRLIILVAAMSGSTIIWSIRPQIFSVLFLPLVAILAARDRWLLVVPVMALWANVHAGVAMGIVVLAGSVAASVVADRDRLPRRLAGAVLGTLATLATPFGLTSWTETFVSVGRSHANHIQEWSPTSLPPANLFFWVLAGVLLWYLGRRWRTLESPEDRALVLEALVTLPLAVRTLRSVPAFTMLAAPALTRLLWRNAARRDEPIRMPGAGYGLVAAIVLAAAVVARAWSVPWAMLQWQPVSPAAAAAIRDCRPPLYNRYFDGGPLIWFVPDQRVFLDSRQDPFPVSFVQDATRVESTGDYQTLFDRWHIRCAALPPDSLTTRHLLHDGWRVRFRDRRWLVLERPGESTAATTSPALPPGS